MNITVGARFMPKKKSGHFIFVPRHNHPGTHPSIYSCEKKSDESEKNAVRVRAKKKCVFIVFIFLHSFAIAGCPTAHTDTRKIHHTLEIMLQ